MDHRIRPLLKIEPKIETLFGSVSDSMEVLERRAQELFPGTTVIVREGDPATFPFSSSADASCGCTTSSK